MNTILVLNPATFYNTGETVMLSQLTVRAMRCLEYEADREPADDAPDSEFEAASERLMWTKVRAERHEALLKEMFRAQAN